MNLFYSIISLEDQPQADPLMSLGGFVSSSQVPSGRTNALFSTISSYTIQQGREQYVCLILRNTTKKTASGIKFWFQFDPSQAYICKYRVAFTEAVDREFESTPDPFSKPVYAQFESCNGIDEAMALPDLEPDEMIGIWVERSIDKTSEELSNRNNCEWLFENRDREIETEETLDIKIDFNFL